MLGEDECVPLVLKELFGKLLKMRSAASEVQREFSFVLFFILNKRTKKKPEGAGGCHKP
jgi:hypothetical protein